MRYAQIIYEKLSSLLLESNLPSLEDFSNPLDYVKALWNIYNEQYFDNRLDTPAFRWMKDTDRVRTYAQFSYKLRKADGSIFDETISVNKKLLRNLELLQDTLLHEMCHQAVVEIDNDFSDKHGPLWKKWARSCGIDDSAKTDREIPKTYSEEEREIAQQQRNSEYKDAYLSLMQDRIPISKPKEGDFVAYATSVNGNPTLDFGFISKAPKTGRFVTIASREGDKLFSMKMNKEYVYSLTSEEEARLKTLYPPELRRNIINYFNEKSALKRHMIFQEIEKQLCS